MPSSCCSSNEAYLKKNKSKKRAKYWVKKTPVKRLWEYQTKKPKPLGLWNIVNGKDKKPSTREGEVNWISKDEKVLSIIALSLSDEYINHIDGMDTS